MGTSNWQNIPYNIDLIRKINPHSILDIGVGFGRWGILFREFLEIWDEGNYSGNWNRIIEGIEIFPGYIKDYHKYFYTQIYFENAMNFLENTNKKWELINCGDVIEHFEKPEGIEFIRICLNKAKFLIINVPIGMNWPQGEKNDNQFEIHKSIWHNRDFKNFGHYKIKNFRDHYFRKYSVILLSKTLFDFNKDYIKKYGKYLKQKNFIKFRLHLNWFLKLIEKYKKKY